MTGEKKMNNILNRRKIFFRLIWTVICIAAVVFTFTDHVTACGGDGKPTALFFTTWTVWLCALSAILNLTAAVISEKTGKEQQSVFLLGFIKFSADIMAIATFIVAAFVLPEKLWTAEYWEVGKVFKHFLLPVLTIIDELFVENRLIYSIATPFYGIITSLTYWVIVVCRALSFRSSQGGSIPEELYGNYYPYGFTNFDTGHTVKGLCIMLSGILAGLILMGFGIVLKNKKNTKK